MLKTGRRKGWFFSERRERREKRSKGMVVPTLQFFISVKTVRR